MRVYTFAYIYPNGLGPARTFLQLTPGELARVASGDPEMNFIEDRASTIEQARIIWEAKAAGWIP